MTDKLVFVYFSTSGAITNWKYLHCHCICFITHITEHTESADDMHYNSSRAFSLNSSKFNQAAFWAFPPPHRWYWNNLQTCVNACRLAILDLNLKPGLIHSNPAVSDRYTWFI